MQFVASVVVSYTECWLLSDLPLQKGLLVKSMGTSWRPAFRVPNKPYIGTQGTSSESHRCWWIPLGKRRAPIKNRTVIIFLVSRATATKERAFSCRAEQKKPQIRLR